MLVLLLFGQRSSEYTHKKTIINKSKYKEMKDVEKGNATKAYIITENENLQLYRK